MRRSAGRLGLVLGLTFASASGHVTSAAVTQPPNVTSPSKDAVQDVALAFGISFDEAERRAALQELAQLIRPAARAADVGYLGIWINDANDALVYASTDLSQAARALAPFSMPEDTIEYQQARFSEAELTKLMDSARSALARSGAIPPNANLWVDKLGEYVVLELPIGGVGLDTVRQESADLGITNFRVMAADTGVTEGATIRGGVAATTCTWGFKAFQGSTARMLTAGHCGNTQAWGGINLPFVTGKEVNSGNADGQVHSVPAPHGASNTIVLEDGTFRTITSRRSWSNMDIGDAVCHVGKTTGLSCGAISAVNGAQAVGGGTNVPRVTGTFLEAQPGDSGGPVFSGNAAFGLYEGQNGSAPPNALMIFTASNYIESALGITIATS